jgi:hypothetical protein
MPVAVEKSRVIVGEIANSKEGIDRNNTNNTPLRERHNRLETMAGFQYQNNPMDDTEMK